MHFDHVGGAVKREGEKLTPAFKNATYWSNENHWKWATVPNDREKASFLKENILPIQESGQLKFIEQSAEKESNGIIAAMSVLFVNGHTEAMMIPKISYKGKTIVYMADLLPSMAHIPLPYVMAYDMFPLTTLNEKKSFLTEAQQNDYVLFFEHDRETECCNLQMTDRGIRQKDVFNLSDI